MRTREIVRYDSPEAARQVTVTGWVSLHGRFYGNDEHIARWDGCTHTVCDCGELADKGYTRCERCRAAAIVKQWEAMPIVEWDGETPFCEHDGDRFFFDEDSFYDWCDDEGIDPTEVRLVLCEGRRFRTVDTDYWCDDLPEDGELPDAIRDALDALNAAIRAHDKPAAWYPTKQRIVMKGRE